MASYNKVIVMGNLTKDVELRHTESGLAVADLGIAINERTGRGENIKEVTIFADVTVWDKQAENCANYLKKGSPVHIDGRLKFDQWEDKESGKKRSKLGIVANSVTFLGTKADAPAEKPAEDGKEPDAPAGDPFEGEDSVPF